MAQSVKEYFVIPQHIMGAEGMVVHHFLYAVREDDAIFCLIPRGTTKVRPGEDPRVLDTPEWSPVPPVPGTEAGDQYYDGMVPQ